jgi:hypothetical protein
MVVAFKNEKGVLLITNKLVKRLSNCRSVVYVRSVLSPPATEENGAEGREIESWLGRGW